mmetsp:Transcript_13882/g.22657  ORF Transcript_13882/g.22657 Transcript_13882/m.22657 type:complete len:429 (+) Transcript_13882:59-1345(+)
MMNLKTLFLGVSLVLAVNAEVKPVVPEFIQIASIRELSKKHRVQHVEPVAAVGAFPDFGKIDFKALFEKIFNEITEGITNFADGVEATGGKRAFIKKQDDILNVLVNYTLKNEAAFVAFKTSSSSFVKVMFDLNDIQNSDIKKIEAIINQYGPAWRNLMKHIKDLKNELVSMKSKQATEMAPVFELFSAADDMVASSVHGIKGLVCTAKKVLDKTAAVLKWIGDKKIMGIFDATIKFLVVLDPSNTMIKMGIDMLKKLDALLDEFLPTIISAVEHLAKLADTWFDSMCTSQVALASNGRKLVAQTSRGLISIDLKKIEQVIIDVINKIEAVIAKVMAKLTPYHVKLLHAFMGIVQAVADSFASAKIKAIIKTVDVIMFTDIPGAYPAISPILNTTRDDLVPHVFSTITEGEKLLHSVVTGIKALLHKA